MKDPTALLKAPPYPSLIHLLFAIGAVLSLPLPTRADTNNPYLVEVAISKLNTLVQSNAAGAFNYPFTPFIFLSEVRNDGLAEPQPTTSTLTLPSLPPYTLGYANPGPLGPIPVILVAEAFDTRPEMDAAYPSGEYKVHLDLRVETTGQDQLDLNLPLAGNLYPNNPRLLNITEAQAIPSEKDFVVRWEPLADATEFDQVTLQITEPKTGVASFSIELNGTNSGVSHATIPAGTLLPDREYTGLLTFDRWNAFLVTNYSTAKFDYRIVIRSGYVKVTTFPVYTAISFLPPTTPAPNKFSFRFGAAPGTNYQILESSDFKTWLTNSTVRAVSNSVTYTETRSTSTRLRAFKVRRR